MEMCDTSKNTETKKTRRKACFSFNAPLIGLIA